MSGEKNPKKKSAKEAKLINKIALFDERLFALTRLRHASKQMKASIDQQNHQVSVRLEKCFQDSEQRKIAEERGLISLVE